MKNGILTFFFAFVPGAGQMYQGYMKRGLSLISMFCAGILLASAVTPMIALLPIVWMYSFFDTFNLRAQLGIGAAPADDYLVHLGPDTRLQKLIAQRHTLAGWVLIAVGAYLVYDGFLMSALRSLYWSGSHGPLFDVLYSVLNRLPTLVVCLALIGVGVWLVRGPKAGKCPEEDVCYYEHEEEHRDGE